MYRGGPREPEPHAIDRELTIGRGTDSGLQLDDPSISRAHARVSPREGGLYVTDLGSHNGTFVDGAAIKETLVRYSSIVRLGSSVLIVVDDVADRSRFRVGLAADIARACTEHSIGITAAAFEALLLRDAAIGNAIAKGAEAARARGVSLIDTEDFPFLKKPSTTTAPAHGKALRMRIEAALDAHDGDLDAAAAALGSSRATLEDTIRRLNLKRR